MRRTRPVFSIRVDSISDGETVLSLLKGIPSISRTRLRRAKWSKGVHLNGSPVDVTSRVSEGDLVELVEEVKFDESIEPESMDLKIAYEDRRIVVIDKVPGVLVHPVKTERSNTIGNGLAHLYLVRGEVSGFHPVHRLDRDTSGLVLIAKDPVTHAVLARQMARSILHREYLAVLRGELESDSGTIRRSIRRHGENGSCFQVCDDGSEGRSATTHYTVLQRFSGRTLVRVLLETGRTHQIRVHFASIGHRVVGDRRYADTDPTDEGIGRQALHASGLSFADPEGAGEIRIISELPDDIRAILPRTLLNVDI